MSINRVHDRIYAFPGAYFGKSTPSRETVAPMDPDRRWARAVGKRALQSA